MEVLRDAGRRRRRRLLVALGVLTGLVAVAAATRSPLLDVDEVRVAGGGRTAPDDIAAAAGIDDRAAMVGLDTAAAERRIEALPWVADATVRRSWPGLVTVTVEERTPAAAAAVDEGRWAEVDASGRVLAVTEAGAAAPDGLPALTGVGGPVVPGEPLPVEAGGALTLVDALEGAFPGGIAGVSTDLDATLGYGTAVRFGTADELDAKVTALQTVLERVDLACVATVDVSAPASPALTRHEGCS
jgi:cell division protein FtsQ